MVGSVLPLAPPTKALFVTEAAVMVLEPGPIGPPLSMRPKSLPVTGAKLEVEISAITPHVVAWVVAAAGKPDADATVIVLSPPQAIAEAQATARTPPTSTPELARGISLGDTLTATVVRVLRPQSMPLAPGPKASREIHAPALPVGTRLAVRLTGYGESAGRSGTQATTRPPHRATVVGHDQQGAVLVKIDTMILRLPTDAPFPVDTTLLLQPMSAPLLPPMPVIDPNMVEPGTRPQLSALAQAVAAPEPAVAKTVADALPSNSPHGVRNLIAYLFALRTGDPHQWLGERASQALNQAGRGALVEQLGDEMRLFARPPGETTGMEWRAMPLPWHDGEELHFPTLWLHDRFFPEEETDRDGAEFGTRLIIDLELSRLGPVQIDGFYRNSTFDVTVRSGEPLQQAVQDNLKHIFAEVLDTSGLTGSLNLSTNAMPMPAPADAPMPRKEERDV
jgi:hypothetical protein